MKKRPAKKKSNTGENQPGRQVYFSPWRLNYILSPKDSKCFFCAAARLREDDDAGWKKLLLLHRSKHGMVIMNRYPYTGGHVLIAPVRHTADLPKLSARESAYMWDFTRHAVRIVDSVVHANGFNIGMNLGRFAGAGVEEHLHMHALPRWGSDTNFMHIVADTSLVPLSLDLLWDQMRPAFRKL